MSGNLAQAVSAGGLLDKVATASLMERPSYSTNPSLGTQQCQAHHDASGRHPMWSSSTSSLIVHSSFLLQHHTVQRSWVSSCSFHVSSSFLLSFGAAWPSESHLSGFLSSFTLASPAFTMDYVLKCNTLTCRRELEQNAVVTTCRCAAWQPEHSCKSSRTNFGEATSFARTVLVASI